MQDFMFSSLFTTEEVQYNNHFVCVYKYKIKMQHRNNTTFTALSLVFWHYKFHLMFTQGLALDLEMGADS